MIEFIKNYWSEFLSVVAILVVLLPSIVHFLFVVLRRIHFVFLDYRVLTSATAHLRSDAPSFIRNGTILIVALNLSIFNESFFAKDIYGEIEYNGKKYRAKLYEGTVASVENNLKYNLKFDETLNLNLNRAIYTGENNLRVATFFFEDVNFGDFAKVEFLKICFKSKILKKKIKITIKECVDSDYINKFKSLVQEQE